MRSNTDSGFISRNYFVVPLGTTLFQREHDFVTSNATLLGSGCVKFLSSNSEMASGANGSSTPNMPGPDPPEDARVLFAELKAQISALTDSLNDAKDAILMKGSKTPTDFNKKGNEVQFVLNTSIVENLQRVIAHINDNKADKAITLLNHAVSELEHRNKCILIADQSEYGWEAVRHYLKPEVSSGESDATRIKNANTSAKRQAQSRAYYDDDRSYNRQYKRSRGQGRGRYQGQQGYSNHYQNNYSVPPMHNLQPQIPNFAGFPQFYQSPVPQFGPPPPAWFSGFPQQQYSNNAPNVTCHHCQQLGHYQKNCPSKRAGYPAAAVPRR